MKRRHASLEMKSFERENIGTAGTHSLLSIFLFSPYAQWSEKNISVFVHWKKIELHWANESTSCAKLLHCANHLGEVERCCMLMTFIKTHNGFTVGRLNIKLWACTWELKQFRPEEKYAPAEMTLSQMYSKSNGHGGFSRRWWLHTIKWVSSIKIAYSF